MKKILLFLTFLTFGFSYAQNIFDKYEDMDGVTSIIATKDMFEMLGSIEPEGKKGKEELELLKNLTGLKVFSTDKPDLYKQFSNDFNAYIQKKNMKELLRINDEDANVKFYVIKGSKPYLAKELVMILTGKNKKQGMVIMDITGNIDLRKLSKLNSKVQVVNKKYFEEVEKSIKNQ